MPDKSHKLISGLFFFWVLLRAPCLPHKEIIFLLCTGTPQSTRDTKEVPPEPNYLSDSQLYPDIRHRRHASASSARLRALPSLRRGDAGRRRTAVLERKRNNVMKQALSRGTVAPGQPAKVWRVRDGKFHQMEWKGPTNLEARFLVFFCAVCSAMVWFA